MSFLINKMKVFGEDNDGIQSRLRETTRCCKNVKIARYRFCLWTNINLLLHKRKTPIVNPIALEESQIPKIDFSLHEVT